MTTPEPHRRTLPNASDGRHDESIESLLSRLKERVVERRAAGTYPDGLEQELDAHFERIAAHRYPAYDFDSLRSKIDALTAAGAFSPADIRYETRVPGGSFLHRLLGKLVRRQTEGILAQAQRHADAVQEAMREVVRALETPAAHSHIDLVGEIEAIFERLAVYERATTGSAAIGGLTRRLEELENSTTGRFDPWFESERFEARFRGGRDELLERYRDLAATFTNTRGPIVDVGCGRGEFLELLLELGLDARGIEIESELVRSCVDRGLPVDFGEAVTWLSTEFDEAIGGLALIQVVEHLSPQQLVDFVGLTAKKVRPGGKVVIETVNPQSLYSFAHAFYLDPTHTAPIHPAYLMFLFEEAGFAHVDVEWRSPCPPSDRLQPVAPSEHDEDADVHLTKQVNENNERVNELLFAAQDYAVIAVR